MTTCGWVITCEHATNRIPPSWQALFEHDQNVLSTHRAYDAGAATWAHEFASGLGVTSLDANCSRLLIDNNRSLHHRDVFSEYTRGLDASSRADIVDKWYRPHRARVIEVVEKAVSQGRVIHIACHSFVPVLRGETRNALIGLLYDPQRQEERTFCDRWRRQMRARLPDISVRMNYPYRGAADGLTRALRQQFPASRYVGVELEINQCLLEWSPTRQAALRRVVFDAMRRAAYSV